MPALCLLLKWDSVPTVAQVRQLQERLAQEDACLIRRTLFPALAHLAVRDLSLPDAAGLLDKLSEYLFIRSPEGEAWASSVAAFVLDPFEERLSPPEALDHYCAFTTRLVAELPQLPSASFSRGRPGEPKGLSGANAAPRGGEDFVLTPEDIRILKVLAARRPTTVNQYDLETELGLSRGTIGPRLKQLRAWGLVDRPRGERKGDTITPEGIRVLGHCAD
jgi:hypothetical protein